MTNEELACRIQDGQDKSGEFLLTLWEQVKPLVASMAHRRSEGERAADYEDFMQAGFLALLVALKRFERDRGTAFTTGLTFAIKDEFRKAAGKQPGIREKDPIHSAGSLERPLGDDADGGTLAEIVSGKDNIAEAEERILRDDLRREIEAEMKALSPIERQVLRCRFWRSLTLEKAGAAVGLTGSAVAYREKVALHKLAESKRLRALASAL